MKLSKSVAELQREHIVMELECIDRMYLNAYVPQLTTEAGVAGFVRGYLGHRFASTKQVAQMTDTFVASIMQFALDHHIDLVRFEKGQRKDDVMQRRLRAFKKKHQRGVVFIGVAQETNLSISGNLGSQSSSKSATIGIPAARAIDAALRFP